MVQWDVFRLKIKVAVEVRPLSRFMMPLIGWLSSLAAGYPAKFGLNQLPYYITKSAADSRISWLFTTFVCTFPVLVVGVAQKP